MAPTRGCGCRSALRSFQKVRAHTLFRGLFLKMPNQRRDTSFVLIDSDVNRSRSAISSLFEQ
jgi:hypothetical protein